MTTTLHEKSSGYRQGTRAVVPESNGALIDVRLMGWEPGSDVVEGSSGDYPIAAIVRDFAEAFPVGTRMRANHDGMCDAGGDIRRVMAKTVSLPQKREDGMYAKARVREGDATDFLRQFADVIGTSVSVGVELEQIQDTDDDGEPKFDYEGNPVMVNKLSERGAPIVKRFLSMSESPYNSVDFVEAPGADGAVVSIALEAARGIVEHTTLREAATFTLDVAGEREKTPEATPPRVNKKEKHMDEQEQSAFAERVGMTVASAVVEALRPSAPTSDQPTLEQAAEAVVTAGLTEAGRRAVYARLDRGEALEAAIAAEVEREANIDAEVERRLAERQAATQRESIFDFGYTTDDKTGKPLGTEGQGADTLRAHEAEFDAAFQEG
jgi:hypothetical protein